MAAKKQQPQLIAKLPSPMAMTLAAEVGLLQFDPSLPIINKHLKQNEKKYDDNMQAAWMGRLRLFQQMALAGAEYKDCKIVYRGFRLTLVHTKVLKQIYKYTLPWVKGYIVDELISQVELGRDGWDSVAVATLIDKLLTPTEEGKGAGELAVTGSIRIDQYDAEL